MLSKIQKAPAPISRNSSTSDLSIDERPSDGELLEVDSDTNNNNNNDQHHQHHHHHHTSQTSTTAGREAQQSQDQRQDEDDNNNNTTSGQTNPADNDNNNDTTNLDRNLEEPAKLAPAAIKRQQSASPEPEVAAGGQSELLDIVEVSRKRRLSKDSADSLTTFIRWSFNKHLPQQQQQQSRSQLEAAERSRRPTPVDRKSPDELWPADSLKRKLRDELKPTLSQRSVGLDAEPTKRARTLPAEPDVGGRRSFSQQLGSVVDRLHQQQRTRQQLDDHLQHRQHPHLQQVQQEPEALRQSFNLQRFLAAQQGSPLAASLESPANANEQQLALAAAIHRALLDSSRAGSGASTSHSAGGQLDSLAARFGQRFARPAATSGHLQSTSQQQQQQQQQQQLQQRTSSLVAAAMSMSAARLHQHQGSQRQSQAAAALSALAGAGPHSQAAAAAAAAALHLANQQQTTGGLKGHHQHHHQLLRQPGAALLARPPGSGLPTQPVAGSGAPLASLLAANQLGPMVEFKCDICANSFDDRHRLMQHQSIHLELKPDWFNETPVDEVMRFLDRKRGVFLCQLCNLRFEATLDYDQHNHAVHGSRPYCCQFCGNGTRTFKCWRQYLNHLYDHRYIFSCAIGDCDFTVNRRDSLRFHIFRFHLNCQLPQSQTNNTNSSTNLQPTPQQQINSAGAPSGFNTRQLDRHQTGSLAGDWSPIDDDHDEPDVVEDQQEDDDLDERDREQEEQDLLKLDQAHRQPTSDDDEDHQEDLMDRDDDGPLRIWT